MKIKNIKIALQAFIAELVLKFLYKTSKWDVQGAENYLKLLKGNDSVIISCWHGRLLPVLFHLSYNDYYGLVGTHKDGEIISRVGQNLVWNILRGSSSNNGARAYAKMVSILRKKPSLFAITPDGPKGPPKIPKPGIIIAAQKTSSYIVPVTICSTKNWVFSNWDDFYVEKPFSKIYIKFGNPIFFKEIDSFEDCRIRLTNEMSKLEEENINRAKKTI